MRSVLLPLALSFAFTSAFAQSSDDYTLKPAPSVKEITKGIIRVANLYNRSITCGTEELEPDEGVQPQDIAALIPWKDELDQFNAKFAVILGGDIGCLGGSGTYLNYLVIMKVGRWGDFYVDVTDELPVFDLPTRFVTRLVGNTADTIIIDALVHRENDSNNFPTQKVRYTLQKEAGQRTGWKVIEKKNMGIHSY